MSLLKCKMCGGNIQVQDQASIGICDSCGSTMTLPREADERKANLFNRANHYRRGNDFDKGLATYEAILTESPQDAEAHWGVVLCKYGIEYVEDPQSGRRVPTCHRAQYGSILADEDTRQAIANADPDARALYEAEAKEIDKIQKQILDISAKEEPFDVFLCYKETSESGQRTKDSVIAQDIYYHLTNAGHKVFFARITLEDKLGSAFEPYIFAALNSARVMVVLGTKPEHFNAVWTKNEWSRYLALIKNGAKKTLIPAYRDMDAYELPEEFSHLQAQDMGRIGFIQDLTRGIQKLLDEEKATPAQKNAGNADAGASPTAQSLVKRAFIFLEDGEFSKADELLEKALDIDPEFGTAYLGKLMVEMEVRKKEEIKAQSTPPSNFKNYAKVIKFGSKAERDLVEQADQTIQELDDTNRKAKIYNAATRRFDQGRLQEAIDLWASIIPYQASEENIRLAQEELLRVEEEDKKALNRILVILGVVFTLLIASYFVYTYFLVPYQKN